MYHLSTQRTHVRPLQAVPPTPAIGATRPLNPPMLAATAPLISHIAPHPIASGYVVVPVDAWYLYAWTAGAWIPCVAGWLSLRPVFDSNLSTVINDTE